MGNKEMYDLELNFVEAHNGLFMLAKEYEVSPEVFYKGIIEGSINGRRDVAVLNAFSLFTNPTVRQLFDTACTEGPFKSQAAYREAIAETVAYVSDRYITPVDFSSIEPFRFMWRELEQYRKVNGSATNDAVLIQSALTELFAHYKDDLAALGMRPNVYGSVRYGDAGKSSDIDVNFLVTDKDVDLQEKKDLVNVIDLELDEEFFMLKKKIRQIKDILNPERLLVDMTQLNGVLTDIEFEDTDSIGDYEFRKTPFFPYSWLLEGESYVDGLGQIDEETEEVKRMILAAVEKDPFFEFLMCYSLFSALQERRAKQD